jgi:hypothetical protein
MTGDKITVEAKTYDSMFLDHNIQKGQYRFIIQYDPRQHRELAKWYAAFNKAQKEQDKENTYMVTFDKSQSKTGKQTRYFWKSLQLLADVLNAGKIGKDMVTKEQLYKDYVREYAPNYLAVVPEEHKRIILTSHSHYEIVRDQDGNPKKRDDKTLYRIWEGMSGWDKEFTAMMIEVVLNELSEQSPTHAQALAGKKIWLDHMDYLNRHKIVLHQTIVDKQRYKELVPRCEASGDWLGQGGHVHHIKAIGMGGNPETEKDVASNWLHLRSDLHIAAGSSESIHNNLGKFLETYHHLSHKIKTALNLY